MSIEFSGAINRFGHSNVRNNYYLNEKFDLFPLFSQNEPDLSGFTFLNKIKETFGENILIGYGNWSRSSQMKHFMPTMNKGLRKLIHKKYDTITIN